MADADVVVDATGQVIAWGSMAEALLGFSAEEAVGRPVTAFLGSSAGGRRGFTTVPNKAGVPVSLSLTVQPDVVGDGGVRWRVHLMAAADADMASIDRAVLKALFTESPLGLHVVDPQLRLIQYNSAFPGMKGVRRQDALGRSLHEVAPELVSEAIERVLKQVMDTGEPVIDMVQQGAPPSEPGKDHVYSLSAIRLLDDAQRVLGAATIAIDVTDRHRVRDRLELLNKASSRIGTTLDVSRTAEELADVAVPRLADAVAVDVLDTVFRGEAVSPGPVGVQATLRRTAFLTGAEGRLRAAYPVGSVNTIAPATPITQCLTDLRPRLLRRITSDSPWLTREPLRAARIRAARVGSLMVVPLTARGVVLGVISLYRWRERDSFDDDDLVTATELAAHTAVCMDNARRYTREATAARILQHSLLPARLPQQDAVEVAFSHLTAGKGTGWYDVIPLPGSRVALVLGTVSGHGLRASAVMGRLRAAVHTLAGLDLQPDEVLAHLADLMARLGEPVGLTDNSTPQKPTRATCVYLIYDPTSGNCVLARAAHSAPAVVYPDGTVSAVRAPAGPALGAGKEPFVSTTVHLPTGALLALFTPELLRSQRRAPRRNLRRLRWLLAHPARVLQDTCDEAIYSLVHEYPEKDVILLVARTHTLAPGQIASWTFPRDPAVVSTARQLVARQLAVWDLQDLGFTTEVLVSELLTNAIRYAGGQPNLRLIHSRTLTCEVSDDSSTAPHVRHPRTTDEGGRGLLLVAQLAERWGTRHTLDGKIVWAEQNMPEGSRGSAESGR
ncbi:SpoIIE family protein phosphatase [Streptomyces shenzhenensis]|uniref:SpoIIE family protein phosphatase n=1 Tax=Streptomyces shenzhenensis TaxID=943815 RepID=UPI003D937AA0